MQRLVFAHIQRQNGKYRLFIRISTHIIPMDISSRPPSELHCLICTWAFTQITSISTDRDKLEV